MPGQTRTPGDICGTLLYSISYVFSGQKAVGSSFATSRIMAGTALQGVAGDSVSVTCTATTSD